MRQKSLKSFFSSNKADIEQTVATSEKRKSPGNDPQNKAPNKVFTENRELSCSSIIKPTSLIPCSENIDPTLYDPSKDKYNPIKDAVWEHGTQTPYAALTRTFEEIEQISSRLKIISTLSNLFCSIIKLSDQDLTPCIYLCLNRLTPSYQPLKLGVGDSHLIKAISQTTGKNPKQIKTMLQSVGDLGSVAESCRTTQNTLFNPKRLTISHVFTTLRDIAHLTGHQAVNSKCNKIQSMLVASRHGSEAKYLIRSLGGKLRIGLAEQSVLAALAQAFSQIKSVIDDYEINLQLLKSAYCQCPSYERMVETLLKSDFRKLKKIVINPGIPVKPMLAQPSRSVEAAFNTFDGNSFTCEYKYDGERAQIHKLSDGTVQVFSRNLDPTIEKFPEISSIMGESVLEGVESFIIDSEIVAWDLKSSKIMPFQQLSTRKRKDVNVETISVTVCIFAFDVLYINGISLLKSSLRERREVLHSSFQLVPGKFMVAEHSDSFENEEIDNFLTSALKCGCEGLMLKTLDINATYEISKRSHKWLKLKKDYLDGMGDTLDLVVIGAYCGTGKRTGTYGGFLLACYNPSTEEYETICKIGTGFSDEDLKNHTESLNDLIIARPKSYYAFDSAANTQPDVWFEPNVVWEVKAADLSISPCYKAAIGIIESNRGISLRFPRFVRIRSDKNPENATTSNQIAQFYHSQQNIANQAPKSDEDAYY